MEHTIAKITTTTIIMEVNMMEHLEWTNDDRLERIEVLKKSIKMCEDILADVLETDYSTRPYWINQKSTIERYLTICQIGAFMDGTAALNIETKESVFTPYQEPETDEEEVKTNSRLVVLGMILFWVFFILACIVA
jgi:hypothetical protein